MKNAQEGLPPKLSIIIVNYNGKGFLGDCLDSVAKHVHCPYEVILVDNASTDESCAFLRKHFPNVTVIENDWNAGFTGGNNIGARAAKGELLLLLNNDTILLSDIAPAIEAFEDSSIGVLGCRLVYEDGRLQPSYGYTHSPLRLILFWSGLGDATKWFGAAKLGETDPGCYETRQYNVAWVSGAFLMTRRILWERLGGLDEEYFMYVEDVDYCARCVAAGYRNLYVPDVRVLHYGGGGRAWVGHSALTNTIQSYLIFTRKFYGHTGLVALRVGLATVMSVRATLYGLGGLLLRSTVLRQKNRSFFIAAGQLLRGRKKSVASTQLTGDS